MKIGDLHPKALAVLEAIIAAKVPGENRIDSVNMDDVHSAIYDWLKDDLWLIAPNELDACYARLSDPRMQRREAKGAASDIHKRIRKLRSEGMEPTTDPMCSNGHCKVIVEGGWGQWCEECRKGTYGV